MMVWLPLPFLCYCIYTDMRERKIYNHATYTLALTALVGRTITEGLGSLLPYLGVLIGVMVVLNLAKGLKIGGGDLKLLLALCLFLSPDQAKVMLLWFLVLLMASSMYRYARVHGLDGLGRTLQLEIATAGSARNEKTRVLGAPIITGAYLLSVLGPLLLGGIG